MRKMLGNFRTLNAVVEVYFNKNEPGPRPRVTLSLNEHTVALITAHCLTTIYFPLGKVRGGLLRISVAHLDSVMMIILISLITL